MPIAGPPTCISPSRGLHKPDTKVTYRRERIDMNLGNRLLYLGKVVGDVGLEPTTR